MYSILAVGAIMVLDSFGFGIPGYLSPLVTFGIAGCFLQKSMRVARALDRESTGWWGRGAGRERDLSLQAESSPMVPRFLLLLITSLIIAALLAGCGEQAAPPVTPAATTEPTMIPATVAPVPETTAPSEPFPGALSLGTPFQYGREDIAMEVTVYKVRVMDEYEWWSPQWGRYWNTTPKTGNRFLFTFIRLIDRGTGRARLPSPSMFVLKENGDSYVQTTDRDTSLRIKGIDVKQYDFYYDEKGGWIDPGDSNTVDGFLLYEVPATLAPEHAYLEATFSSKAAAVWKLG
jgi:hypothetical protein